MFKAVGSGQASQAVHPAFLTPTFDSDCEGNIKAFLRKKASINIYSCRLQNQSLLQWSKVGKTLVDLTHPPLYSSSWMYNLNGLWVGAKTPPPLDPYTYAVCYLYYSFCAGLIQFEVASYEAPESIGTDNLALRICFIYDITSEIRARVSTIDGTAAGISMSQQDNYL